MSSKPDFVYLEPVHRLCFLLFSCLIVNGIFAQNQQNLLVIEHYPKEIYLKPYMEVWIDSVDDRTQIQLASDQFPSNPLSEINLPLPLEQALWGRFYLTNLLPDTLDLVLVPGRSDYVEVYVVMGDDVQVKKTGNYIPPSERDITLGADEAIQFRAPPHDTLAFYIHLEEREGQGPYMVPFLINRERYFYKLYDSTYWDNIFIFLFQGAVIMFMLYNLVVFFNVKDRIYAYYALYLFCLVVLVHFETVVGRLPLLGFPQQVGNYLAGFAAFSFASASYLQFGRAFLNTPSRHPVWDRIIKGIIGIRISLIVFGIAITLIRNTIFRFSTIGILLYALESLILIPFFVTLIRSKSILARYFIVGSTLVFGLAFFQIFLVNVIGVDMNPFFTIIISLSLEILVFSLGIGYKMRKQQKEKLEAEKSLNEELKKINTAFGRFVPHEFIHSLGHESVVDVKLGDQVEKEVTVLFSDIRGYTSLAEEMNPAENFRFLNAYLGRVGPVIQRHGGFVNQYYGDGVMALFLDKPAHALAAAEEMHQVVRAYNEERQQKDRAPIRIGIGMHTGPLMMGIIGDTLRMEASVVSDTVNTTSRMEGLTKYFGAGIILSETVFSQLPADRQEDMRYLGRVLVKGRKQPTHIYESLPGHIQEKANSLRKHKSAFETSVKAYLKGDFATALKGLDTLLEMLPEDRAVAYYHRLAKQYLVEGPPEGWEGVETMLDK